MTPESIERVRDLVRGTAECVAMVAAKKVLDRTLGKPSDMPQGDDDRHGAADLTNLTAADRIELSAALATVKRLTGRGPGAL